MTHARLPVVALAALGLSLSTTVGVSQAAAQAQQEAPAPSQNFEAKQLQAFAAASVEIQRVGQKYQSQIQGAQTVEETQALRQRQIEEMVNSVQSSGLSIDEYNQIHAAYRVDPEVRQKVNGLLPDAP